MLRRCIRFWACITVTFLAVACGGEESPTDPEDGGDGGDSIHRIEVTPQTHTLTALGSTLDYEAVALTSDGDTVTAVSFSWSSSDESVATVHPVSGHATSEGEGETAITASAEDKTADAKLMVDLPADRLVFATGPSNVMGLEPISPAVKVVVLDSAGNRATGSLITINVKVASDAMGGHPHLTGTTTVQASDGVAIFDNLSIDRPGSEFTLEAVADSNLNVEPDTSESFKVSLEFVQVSAGRSQTCAVTTNNHAFCWGSNGNGMLGSDGPRLDGRPVAVEGGYEFVQVAAGYLFTCGLTPAGKLLCWGNNDFGQLGDGTTNDHTTPAPVNVSNLSTPTFSQISTGWDFACAVRTDGKPFCWGWNKYYQLGDSTSTDRLMSPVAVNVSGLSTSSFANLTGGGIHACGLTTADEIFCWGHNDDGQLGDGSTLEGRTPVTVQVSDLVTPTFKSVSGGRAHTCGVTTSDEVFCWGWNEHHQLGDGTTTNRSIPVAVDVSSLSTSSFDNVSSGDDHACGLTTTGKLFCWGRNNSGQLGDGTTTNRSIPVAVDVSSLSTPTFKSVSGGGGHACGLTTDGELFCWGNNHYGELGDGSTADSDTPVQVIQ